MSDHACTNPDLKRYPAIINTLAVLMVAAAMACGCATGRRAAISQPPRGVECVAAKAPPSQPEAPAKVLSGSSASGARALLDALRSKPLRQHTQHPDRYKTYREFGYRLDQELDALRSCVKAPPPKRYRVRLVVMLSRKARILEARVCNQALSETAKRCIANIVLELPLHSRDLEWPGHRMRWTLRLKVE